eukprot:3521-Heterococcus_DN1.PRE.3
MAGHKVLAGLSEELASAVFQGNERDVLEFDLCLVGLQICEFTCGHGSPQLVPYFDRAIQISRKRSVEAAGVLIEHEVLQAKLFKAHYLLYQEHVMRDEESDAVRTVLQPLYQAYSGRYAFILTRSTLIHTVLACSQACTVERPILNTVIEQFYDQHHETEC